MHYHCDSLNEIIMKKQCNVSFKKTIVNPNIINREKNNLTLGLYSVRLFTSPSLYPLQHGYWLRLL